tara:strand:- start:323 stop:1348 length:1026 start_codon:yes stop_codon:yes gene_type:complete
MKKIILINCTLIVFLTLIGELILGAWFDKNNFGIHMRGQFNNSFKMVSEGASVSGETQEFTFFRNSLAFRNYEVEAKDIDVIFNGGSTTVQSYLPYEQTIVGLLNKSLEDKNIIIANAGLEGKSTYGYLCDFKNWFSKIEDLNPKYYIFYTGYNDIWNSSNIVGQKYCEGVTARQTKKHQLIDYLVNNSFLISSGLKLKNKYFEQKVTFNANTYGSFYNQGSISYTAYEEAKKLNIKFKNPDPTRVPRYKRNLESLKKIIVAKRITPIFITQVDSLGNYNPVIRQINDITKNFAEDNNFIIIKLDEEINLKTSDFYDDVHTNKIGSEKVANFIYNKINDLF